MLCIFKNYLHIDSFTDIIGFIVLEYLSGYFNAKIRLIAEFKCSTFVKSDLTGGLFFGPTVQDCSLYLKIILARVAAL